MKVNPALKSKNRPFAAVTSRIILGLTGISLVGIGKKFAGLPAYIRDCVAYNQATYKGRNIPCF